MAAMAALSAWSEMTDGKGGLRIKLDCSARRALRSPGRQSSRDRTPRGGVGASEPMMNASFRRRPCKAR